MKITCKQWTFALKAFTKNFLELCILAAVDNNVLCTIGRALFNAVFKMCLDFITSGQPIYWPVNINKTVRKAADESDGSLHS